MPAIKPEPEFPRWWSDLGPSASRSLFERLTSVVEAEALKEWMNVPNPAFGGATPASLVREGDTQLLEVMVFRLESGIPS